jgi:lipid-A-disaccharide synthase
LPGSRQSEILRLMPLMIGTARTMIKRDDQLKFILPVARSLDFDEISKQCTDSGVEIIPSQDNIYDLISSCDAIVSCSGTVTLEIALLQVPLCIVYKMSWLSYQIMSRLITIPHIGLVNIVADGGIVTELLQDDANPDRVSKELFDLLENQVTIDKVKKGLTQARENLGAGSGSENVAKLIIKLLGN